MAANARETTTKVAEEPQHGLIRPSQIAKWLVSNKESSFVWQSAEIEAKSPVAISREQLDPCAKTRSQPSWSQVQWHSDASGVLAQATAANGQADASRRSEAWSAMQQHPFFKLLASACRRHSSRCPPLSWQCFFLELCCSLGAIPSYAHPQQIHDVLRYTKQQIPQTNAGHEQELSKTVHAVMYNWAVSATQYNSSWAQVVRFARAPDGLNMHASLVGPENFNLPERLHLLDHVLSALSQRYLQSFSYESFAECARLHEHREACPCCSALNLGSARTPASLTKRGLMHARTQGQRRKEFVQNRSSGGGTGRWPDHLLQELRRNAVNDVVPVPPQHMRTMKATNAFLKSSAESLEYKSVARVAPELLHAEREEEYSEAAKTATQRHKQDTATGIFYNLESLRPVKALTRSRKQQRIATLQNTSTRVVRFLPRTDNPFTELKFCAKPVAPGGSFHLKIVFKTDTRGSFTVRVAVGRQHLDGARLPAAKLTLQFTNR